MPTGTTYCRDLTSTRWTVALCFQACYPFTKTCFFRISSTSPQAVHNTVSTPSENTKSAYAIPFQWHSNVIRQIESDSADLTAQLLKLRTLQFNKYCTVGCRYQPGIPQNICSLDRSWTSTSPWMGTSYSHVCGQRFIARLRSSNIFSETLRWTIYQASLQHQEPHTSLPPSIYLEVPATIHAAPHLHVGCNCQNPIAQSLLPKQLTNNRTSIRFQLFRHNLSDISNLNR